MDCAALGEEIDCAPQPSPDPGRRRPPTCGGEQLDLSAAAPRPVAGLFPGRRGRSGMLLGFPGHHAFTHRPTYRRLQGPNAREELAERLADPKVRAAILAEEDLPIDPGKLFDGMFMLAQNVSQSPVPHREPPDC